jgi:hypothetical protein
VNGNAATLQTVDRDGRGLGPARGRSRRTCGDRVLQFREVDVDDAGGRHGLLCGHAILQRLPEHGRRLDAVDHPVHDAVVRLRHVDVRHGDLTTGLGVCTLLPPAGLDSAARLAPRSPFCEPRRAGRRGTGRAHDGGDRLWPCEHEGGESDGRVAIGQGLEGPAGLKATVYATGLRNVSAFAFDSSGRLWATTSAASDHSSDAVPLAVVADGALLVGDWTRGTTYRVARVSRVRRSAS